MKVFPFNLRITALDQFSETFATVGSKMDRLGKKAKRLGQSMSIGITAPLAFFGKQAIDTQIQLEAMENKMAAALGGFDQARGEIERLKNESNRMGINFLTAADSFAIFAASATRTGISVEDTRQIFTDFGETAVALKLSQEKVDRIFGALAQIAGKGTLSMEELRQQLGDHIPGAVTIAAKSMGKTTAEFIKMVSNGEIAATDFLPKFGAAVRRELGGSFEQASQSASASLARYQNAMIELKAEVANSGLMDALLAFVKVLGQIANAFSGLSPGMKKAIVYFLMISAALGPILFAFGQLSIILGFVIANFAIIAAAAPWVLLAGLVAGVVFMFKKLVDKVGSVKKAIILLGAVVLDALVSPFRLFALAVEKIWSLFGTPPPALKAISRGSFVRLADAAIDGKPSDQVSQARAAIQGAQENYALQNALMKGGKASVEVLFKNPPDGMRTNVKSESNANVTIDQGVAMEGNY